MTSVLMVHRARSFLVLGAAAVAAVALVPTGGAGLRSRSASPSELPTIYVRYTNQCTFTLQNDFGQAISNIQPGKYQIQVVTPIMFKLLVPSGDANAEHMAPGDMTGCRGWVQFQLTGPGINDFTTLDSGCDAFYVLPSANFQNNSQYVFQDLNQPSATQTVLQVSTNGTKWTPTNPYGANISKGSVQKDLVGSDISKTPKGTLYGTLSPTGDALLKWKGKAASTLKQGRYAFQINDLSSKGAFTIQLAKGKPDSLTPVSFTGHHRVFVTLTAGVWTYYSGLGKARSILVTR